MSDYLDMLRHDVRRLRQQKVEINDKINNLMDLIAEEKRKLAGKEPDKWVQCDFCGEYFGPAEVSDVEDDFGKVEKNCEGCHRKKTYWR